jgi:hypothetical protein
MKLAFAYVRVVGGGLEVDTKEILGLQYWLVFK